jgi:hypothetical protein
MGEGGGAAAYPLGTSLSPSDPVSLTISHILTMPMSLTISHILMMSTSLTISHILIMPMSLTISHILTMPMSLTISHIATMPMSLSDPPFRFTDLYLEYIHATCPDNSILIKCSDAPQHATFYILQLLFLI